MVKSYAGNKKMVLFDSMKEKQAIAENNLLQFDFERLKNQYVELENSFDVKWEVGDYSVTVYIIEPACIWHDALRPSLRIACFFPASRPV